MIIIKNLDMALSKYSSKETKSRQVKCTLECEMKKFAETWKQDVKIAMQSKTFNEITLQGPIADPDSYIITHISTLCTKYMEHLLYTELQLLSHLQVPRVRNSSSACFLRFPGNVQSGFIGKINKASKPSSNLI